MLFNPFQIDVEISNQYVDTIFCNLHLLMSTLVRRLNNRKKPNNMEGNKEEELAKREEYH